MLRKIEKTVDKYNMLADCETVICAVSGGADSMCMLFLLKLLCEKRHIRLICAHFDHNLRGSDSDSDREYVKKYCLENGIEAVIGSGDVKSYAEKNKLSIELAAREMRYAFLYETAGKYSKSKIATAHTKNDNAETVLFNLSRGSAIKGLCGIPAVRENIIRPVIEFTREETEAVCRQNGIEYVTDKTNFDTVYARNKLRIEVLPLLEAVNGNAVDNIFRMSELLKADSDYIDSQADICYEKVKFENYLRLSLLKDCNSAILSRILLKFIKENFDGEIDEKLISGACCLCRSGHSGSRLQISGNVFLVIDYDKLIIRTFENINIPDDIVIDRCGEYAFGDYLVVLNEIKGRKQNTVDRDKISFPVVLSVPSYGDMFFIPKVGKKLLRRVMTDKKISQPQRAVLPILKNGEEIIWAYNIGASQNYKTDANTVNYINIEIKEIPK